MADYPPFMNSYGKIKEILSSIKEAKTPDRFTHDFLATVLGHSGGSSRPFVAFAKRIGLLNSDGTPTDIYKRFRNSGESGAAMAEAVRIGYADLYKRNEYAHKLSREKLDGLLVEMTGLEEGDTTLRAISKSFQALIEIANFDNIAPKVIKKDDVVESREDVNERQESGSKASNRNQSVVGLNYTIYLNLPNTDNPAVFNAIFKSLRENLLEE